MAVVLRSGMSVGAMSAEEDERFLRECFVETDAAAAVMDLASPQCIVLGRTGSGKSAILLHLEQSIPNAIRINPDSLSLNYISNSNIISYFDGLGINLDVFYQLLWRHIFAVELIKAKQRFENERQAKSWIEALFRRFGEDQKKKKALEYLFEFGDSFWADTEERIREVVRNIERKFTEESGIDLKAGPVKVADKAGSEDRTSVAETREVIHKAQRVVNDVQIQELENVLNLLRDDIFDDKYERYYIIIDDLDRDWASDGIRFKLVRALIETIKKFRRLPNVKIIISMRADLLLTVLDKTTSAGFQSEKYEDLYLRMRWTPEELREMLQKRINKLFKDQYTGRDVKLEEVIAPRVGEKDSFDYILERTLERPRDVISYFNECLAVAAGQNKISNKTIRDAEAEYSAKRLRSLADEWREAYGDLEPALRSLKELGARFEFKDLDKKALESYCLTILDGSDEAVRRRCFHSESQAFFSGSLSLTSFREIICQVLYIVGAIGIKADSHSKYEWSYKNRPKFELSRLNADSKFAIHPMLHKALGVYADPRTII